MIRTFRVLLLAVISLYVIMLSMLIVGHIIMWKADSPRPEELNSSPVWQYTNNFGPVKLRKVYNKDVPGGEGKITQYIIIQGATPDSVENGKLYVLNQKNEKVFVEQDMAGESIMLPINASDYSFFKLTAIIALGIAFAVLIWMLVLLFRFLQSALRKDFFTVSNMKRLQTVGWIVTIYGIISWLCTISAPLLIRMVLHYENISGLTPSGMSLFPSWIITGMLLLLIAKAFANGITLKEDNNSIV